MANKTLFGKDARDALLVGIKIVHDATAMSLGARGRNAIFRMYNRPRITNDGVRIARTVDPEDEFAKLGADLIKETAEKTDADAGDGTTTSTVLAYALIEEGLKALADGANPMQLRQEIDDAVRSVIKELEASAVKITGIEDLERVAVVSVENEDLGKMIAGAALRAGVDGTVIVEEHDKPFNERKDVDGYRFDRGLVSPYLITNPEKMEAVVENCPVLVTDKSWNLNSDLVPLVESLHKQGHRNIVVIAEEVGGELLATLIKNSINGLFRSVIVQKPVNADMLDDIAILTGATAMTKTKGMVAVDYAYLGWADKVIATQHTTTIIGGRGDAEKTAKRIKELKEQLPSLEGYEKAKVKERVARLTGGVSIISIGAPTGAERSYLKLKADDAVSACRAALEEGIVPGGGAALYWIGMRAFPSKTQGGEKVMDAITAPMHMIVKSGSGDIEKAPMGGGFNVKTLSWEKDMIAAGIMDPVKVTKSALTNAASLAGVFLTTEVAIVDLPPKNEERHS
jgi:chaperonin GroEL